MKIQILGDSFGLPRNFKNSNKIEITYEDTYAEQLRKMLINEFNEDVIIINSSKRFNNSYFLLKNEFGETYLNQPEFIVIQVGIVDCWTRRDGLYICEEFKGKSPWINEDDYIHYIKTFIDNCFNTIKSLRSVLVVNITKASIEQYKKHEGSFKYTLMYNKRLEQLKGIDNVFLVDVYSEFSRNLNKALCSDGVHPSFYGNKIIANNVFKMICGFEYYIRGKKCLEGKSYKETIGFYLRSLKDYSSINNYEFYSCIRKDVKYISNCFLKLNYDFNDLKNCFFSLLELLIKINEIDLFNDLVNEYSKDYNCGDYEKYGKLMAKYGLNELALIAFKAAVDMRSKDWEVYFYVAKKFLELDELEDALNFAYISLDLNYDTKEIYELIIEIYKKMNLNNKVLEIQNCINNKF